MQPAFLSYKKHILRRIAIAFSLITLLISSLSAMNFQSGDQESSDKKLEELVKNLSVLLQSSDDKNITLLGEKLGNELNKAPTTDSILLSKAYNIMGVYHYYKQEYSEAIRYSEESLKILDALGIHNMRYANTNSNLGAYWYLLGENNKALNYSIKAVSMMREACPEDSSSLADYYLNITSMYLELNEKEKAIDYAEAGLAISNQYPDSVKQGTVADFYQDISISLSRSGDLDRALIYANEALRIYSGEMDSKADSWARLINGIAWIYHKMNNSEMEEKYLRMGIEQSTPKNVDATHGLILSYAWFLISRNQFDKAAKVLTDAMAKAKMSPEKNNSAYPKLMAVYGVTLYRKNKDIDEAKKCFSGCFEYIDSHSWDIRTREEILQKYSEILYEAHHYEESVSILNRILEPYNLEKYSLDEIKHEDGKFSVSLIEALSLKYKALNELSRQTGNWTYTFLAINCGEQLTAIYDRRRLEMSEDKSRAILSDSTRTVYTGLIDNYCSLFKYNHNPLYLSKAFEFAERSKVAGLLAVTRQLNATRFSIPPEMMKASSELKEKIGVYRELIEKERSQEKPNTGKIAGLERYNFRYTRSLDSLVEVFEKRFPDFYRLKYNTQTASLESVPGIIGPKENLLNYVFTDDKLYLFVINKSHKEVLVKNIDKEFYSRLERFRMIISTMPSNTDARAGFNEYMDLAYYLYLNLIAPAEPLLISNKLTISSDNILSYIPFESLITSDYDSNDLLYRNAPYLLKKYKVSYIFSATLASEITDSGLRLKNSTVAFAPTYNERELPDSIIKYFPKLKGKVPDLQFAEEEAATAVELCGGKAFLGTEATESAYKKAAPDYDIIHMAMHTLLDDENPLYSKMIFSEKPGSSDDGLLNTYEVYNVPLKARMVVLSSCNTGSGQLTSGEGIQSLARGFISSGSKSVLMSLWEVEDYAGSEVVKMFYKNLTDGKTKSQALRKARLDFLKVADQRRSHPYFWSTMVVYGDDSPLYYSTAKLGIAALAFFIALFLLAATVYHNVRS